jgi:3-oxoacyl-[acyl-carrier protein] reductase
MFDLTGKSALVTGASGGIGNAIARCLHGAGAKVALTGTRKEALDALAGALGERAFVAPADLSDLAAPAKLVKEVEAALGPVDILVNNAGLTRDNLLLRLSVEDWDAVLQANLRGAFVATQCVIKGMMKRRHGRIINITSVVGVTGNAGQANYAASKAGLIGFTKSVAKEYAARGVLANCIAPGFIETDMTAVLPEAARAALLESIPLGRLGVPAEIAGAALFLASDLAGYVTGQVIVVDGGMIG